MKELDLVLHINSGSMRISIMAAISLNRVIGYQNKLPWQHLPADWENLKQVTAGKKMIMGRKSYESPDRIYSDIGNVVVTQQVGYQVEPGFLVAHSLTQALALVQGEEEIFILGGEKIFQQSLPLVHRMHLTVIQESFTGDTFFPDFTSYPFVETHRTSHSADSRNPYDYDFVVYERL